MKQSLPAPTGQWGSQLALGEAGGGLPSGQVSTLFIRQLASRGL